MSAQYRTFMEEKRLLEEKQTAIYQQLKACENEIETLRRCYSKSCDHPARILQFPVCAICLEFVPNNNIVKEIERK